MMHFLKGGNWQDGVSAGHLNIGFPTIKREIIPFYGFDREGLPDRWVKILNGETGWIPKIVFRFKK